MRAAEVQMHAIFEQHVLRASLLASLNSQPPSARAAAQWLPQSEGEGVAGSVVALSLRGPWLLQLWARSAMPTGS
jgi:hypothetical protein